MLWNIANDKKTVALPEFADSAFAQSQSDMTYSVAFSPDGQMFAQGCNNGIIVIWDLDSRKKIATLVGHTALVRSLAFSPNSKALASASDDKTINLWSVPAVEQLESGSRGKAETRQDRTNDR